MYWVENLRGGLELKIDHEKYCFYSKKIHCQITSTFLTYKHIVNILVVIAMFMQL